MGIILDVLTMFYSNLTSTWKLRSSLFRLYAKFIDFSHLLQRYLYCVYEKVIQKHPRVVLQVGQTIRNQVPKRRIFVFIQQMCIISIAMLQEVAHAFFIDQHGETPKRDLEEPHEHRNPSRCTELEPSKPEDGLLSFEGGCHADIPFVFSYLMKRSLSHYTHNIFFHLFVFHYSF